MPNLDGGLPLFDSGATIGATTNGQAPNITGGFNSQVGRQNVGSSWGAFGRTNIGTGYHGGGGQGSFAGGVEFYASRSSGVYSDTATGIVPAGVYMNWIIKAF